jgi:hypothetical protein
MCSLPDLVLLQTVDLSVELNDLQVKIIDVLISLHHLNLLSQTISLF